MVYAGQFEIYRYGRKAQDYVKASMEPNKNGYYTIVADGGKYWNIGTSEGKFGRFAKFGETFLSVNSMGHIWAKVGTEKAEAFLKMCEKLIDFMKETNEARFSGDEEE